MSKKIIKSNNLLTAYIVKSVISSIAVSALFLLIFSEIIITRAGYNVNYTIW